MIIQSGVILKKDHRDKLWSYFKNQKVGLVSLPRTLGRKLEPSMNQYYSYLCSAFATALAGQYHKRIPMSPEWQAGKISEITGLSIAHVGADPRVAMKASIIWGNLPKAQCPFTLETNGEDYVAEWSNYPQNLDTIALPNHWGGYMPVIPEELDMFDSIRTAMANEYAKHGDNASPVLVGTNWYNVFNQKSQIISASELDTIVSQHMYSFIDFNTIDSVEYLIVQSSTGDTSIKYFSRDVVNTLFQNMISFAAIFTEEERSRGAYLTEAVLKLIYLLRNYVSDIMK